jgi:hypothetical protein
MQRAARLAGLPAAVLLAALLAACQTTGQTTGEAPADTAPEIPAQAEPAQPPAPEADSAALPAPALPAPASRPARPVPHIYMALQSDGTGQPVSAVFAIDAARDNTPSDDPAIRLTPESGLCNPQEMRSYDFPPEDAARPVVGEAEQAQGLTASDLPAFLAVSVTDRMLSRGLADEREQTRPLNICTRKLWERLVLAENPTALTAGQ